jgi:hypothetical protein
MKILRGLIFLSFLCVFAGFFTGCETTGGTGPAIAEYPHWRDVHVETRDYDRIWRTVVDTLGERYTFAVMDKEGGYIKTEWKHADGSNYEDFFTSYNTSTQWRYIARIYPKLGKIRFGFDKSGPITYRADDPNIWSGIPEEMQARLRTTR